MKKLVFIVIITSLAMTGCTQKESEKKTGSSDKKVTTESVKLATCNINVGGIRFTKSKNGGENGITLLGDTLKFVAGPQTDYFRSPDGSVVNNSAVGTYSAGVLYAYENDTHCQKLCFEQDEYGDHRVVSVRTIGTSDDNNHQVIIGPHVYMRLSSDGTTLGSYFSEDGKIWHMARLYRNDFPEKLLLGLSSQSPKDNEHTCYFTEVSLKQEVVPDFRIGKLNEE